MKKAVILFSLLAASFLLLSGCEQNDLGRYCVVGFDSSSADTGIKAINTEAPECINRLCILQTPLTEAEDAKNIQFCSQKCTADSDCSSPSSKKQCGKFVCIKVGDEIPSLSGKGVCQCYEKLASDTLCHNRYNLKDINKEEDCPNELNQ